MLYKGTVQVTFPASALQGWRWRREQRPLPNGKWHSDYRYRDDPDKLLVIYCDPKDVKVQTAFGEMLDPGGEFEYQFVLHNGKTLLCVYIGGDSRKYEDLFPEMGDDEVKDNGHGYLWVPPGNGFRRSKLLIPTGRDEPDDQDHGAKAAPTYLRRILRELR